jgi:transcriptional regulator with XRE-family HTH domain
MEIGERFALILKNKGITQKLFSQRTNYSEQAISKLIKGQTQSPKADLIAQIATLFPDVNLRWLILGEGEMLKEGMSIADETQHELDNLRMENSKLKDKIIELLEK